LCFPIVNLTLTFDDFAGEAYGGETIWGHVTIDIVSLPWVNITATLQSTFGGIFTPASFTWGIAVGQTNRTVAFSYTAPSVVTSSIGNDNAICIVHCIPWHVNSCPVSSQ
jgi:hypothetical protein